MGIQTNGASNSTSDAFRSQFPDVSTHPGFSHRSGRRIDQLYFKGQGLTNTATSVINDWPSLFPSDHYIIKSVFELDVEPIQHERGLMTVPSKLDRVNLN